MCFGFSPTLTYLRNRTRILALLYAPAISLTAGARARSACPLR